MPIEAAKRPATFGVLVGSISLVRQACFDAGTTAFDVCCNICYKSNGTVSGAWV